MEATYSLKKLHLHHRHAQVFHVGFLGNINFCLISSADLRDCGNRDKRYVSDIQFTYEAHVISLFIQFCVELGLQTCYGEICD